MTGSSRGRSSSAPLDESVAAAISLYQRRLSPLKGYSCAHRVLHGGPSCSQHAKGLILDLGLLSAAHPARERLGECREANEALRAGASPAGASWETGRKRRRRGPWYRRWGRRSRDAAEDVFDSDASGSEDLDGSWCAPDSVECDFCDCGIG